MARAVSSTFPEMFGNKASKLCIPSKRARSNPWVHLYVVACLKQERKGSGSMPERCKRPSSQTKVGDHKEDVGDSSPTLSLTALA